MDGQIQITNYDTSVYQPLEIGLPTGWIIIITFLMVGLIIFILLWIFSFSSDLNRSVCFGPFGVAAGFDALPLNKCGTNGTSPCIFSKRTLSDCESQCNVLSSVCNAFTFNSTTSTMKIVTTNSGFVSTGTDLYSRQPG